MNDLLKSVEAPVNLNIPSLHPGDAVSVHVKIKEGNRERIQEFKGTVLFVRSEGNNASFTVRRIASNGDGGGAHLPAAVPTPGQGGGGAPYAGPPGPPVFPARPHRQERPPQAEI